MEKKIWCNVDAVGLPVFKGKTFKRKGCIFDSLTHIKIRKRNRLVIGVQPCQIQKVFDQDIHSSGLKQDVLQPLIFPHTAFQNFCIGGDDGKRCFEFVGGVGNKLFLAVKSHLDRLCDPMGKKEDGDKNKKDSHKADTKADPDKAQGEVFFQGIIQEKDLPALIMFPDQKQIFGDHTTIRSGLLLNDTVGQLQDAFLIHIRVFVIMQLKRCAFLIIKDRKAAEGILAYSSPETVSVAAEERCMNTIRHLGIHDRLRHKPSELSGGQKQRVSIARALVGEPAILLADEPTGALDSTTGREVLKLFKELNDMGHTIVMITHDRNVAAAAGRIVHIIDGRLREDGETEEKA